MGRVNKYLWTVPGMSDGTKNTKLENIVSRQLGGGGGREREGDILYEIAECFY